MKRSYDAELELVERASTEEGWEIPKATASQTNAETAAQTEGIWALHAMAEEPNEVQTPVPEEFPDLSGEHATSAGSDDILEATSLQTYKESGVSSTDGGGNGRDQRPPDEGPAREERGRKSYAQAVA